MSLLLLVADELNDFVVFWKPTDFVFREDQLSFEPHVEDALAAFDEQCFTVEGFLECCRQTDGLGLVVSHAAVLDRKIHGSVFLRNRVGSSSRITSAVILSKTDC